MKLVKMHPPAMHARKCGGVHAEVSADRFGLKVKSHWKHFSFRKCRLSSYKTTAFDTPFLVYEIRGEPIRIISVVIVRVAVVVDITEVVRVVVIRGTLPPIRSGQRFYRNAPI